MVTILITSAGRRNQLIDCFRDGGRRIGLQIRVLACDHRPTLSSACAIADRSFSVPKCNSVEYLAALNEICRAEHVDLVVPTIDTELEILSSARENFERIGIKLVVSHSEVTKLASDKLKTSEVLSLGGVSTPKTLRLRDHLLDPNQLMGKVIAKPNNGSASAGIVRPRSTIEIADLPLDHYIVQELWIGDEYTVNMFFDQSGALRCVVPHRRIEVRSGEVSKGRTERQPALIEAAEKIARALPGARGPLCFQAIVRPDGQFCVFEINARFGGGYPLAHEAGARFTQWLLEESVGKASSANDGWEEGVTMLRYDSAIFTR